MGDIVNLFRHAMDGDLKVKCRVRKITLLATLLSVISILSIHTYSVFISLENQNENMERVGTSSQHFLSKNLKKYNHPQRPVYRKRRTKSRQRRIPQQRQGVRKRPALPQLSKSMIVPPDSSFAANATFSACILIKDDNEILPEWIAYHYHSLNMRQLIVAIDPLSFQSPFDILERWRRVTDLNVQEWSDSDYMPTSFLETGRTPFEYLQKKSDFPGMSDEAFMEVSNHRYRQRVFLTQCMKTLRKQGHSWLLHIDTDEYVVASKLFRQMNPQYVDIPKPEEPGSMLHFIQDIVQYSKELVNYPRISMLRVLFGSFENSLDEQNVNVPTDFNATAFETLRWQYHGFPHNKTIHGNPKVILDVSAIPTDYFEKLDVVFSIHRPIPQICPSNDVLAFANFRKQPIGVNHYLGSWERYSGRSDQRRSRDVYNKKANVIRGRDNGIHTWLDGFVEHVGGSTVASQLLGTTYLVQNNGTTVGTDSLKE